MVIFGVGLTPGDGQLTYSSLVKVLEGRVTDNSAWKKLMTPRTVLPVVAPSQPAPNGSDSILVPPAGNAPMGIKDVVHNNLLKEVKEE